MTDIAKILKDAPKNLKLYSLVHGEVKLNGIYSAQEYYPIEIITDKQDNSYDSFTKDGKIFYDFTDAECMLYPSKEHKSWDGWQDVLFQKGDVITVNGDEILLFNSTDYAFTNKAESRVITKGIYRYATPEEREQFMAELNANGYKLNADTKQIEKIEQQNTPKYKVGDWIKFNDSLCEITNIEDYRYELFYYSTKYKVKIFINEVDTNAVTATEQELIDAGIKKKQFTIDQLKPFNKVLVRNCDDTTWRANFFEYYLNKKDYYEVNLNYICIYGNCAVGYKQCIPYNDETKHLLGTTDDCPKKYKTW